MSPNPNLVIFQKQSRRYIQLGIARSESGQKVNHEVITKMYSDVLVGNLEQTSVIH